MTSSSTPRYSHPLILPTAALFCQPTVLSCQLSPYSANRLLHPANPPGPNPTNCPGPTSAKCRPFLQTAEPQTRHGASLDSKGLAIQHADPVVKRKFTGALTEFNQNRNPVYQSRSYHVKCVPTFDSPHLMCPHIYRSTLLIRKRHPPTDHYRALGRTLL